MPKEPVLGPNTQHNLAGGLEKYSIFANPGLAPPNPKRWKDPVHRHFVNLPVNSTLELGTEIITPEAMLAFSRCHGLLAWLDLSVSPKLLHPYFKREGLLNLVDERYEWVMIVESSPSLETISNRINDYSAKEFRELSSCQSLLKYAWKSGDSRAVEAIAAMTAESLRPQVDVRSGAVVIKVAAPLILIRMLFLRDHALGKTAVCANPECPAPYFIKSRRTQKICEAGGCVAWAQRNYALKWWRDNESKASKGKLKRGEK